MTAIREGFARQVGQAATAKESANHLDAAIMIPAWLLRAEVQRSLGHGSVLVYAALLLFASNHHVKLMDQPRASCCFAMPADLARIVGLTASRVRHILRELAATGLIEFDGEKTLFLQHEWNDDAPDPLRGAMPIDVEGRWANDAYYLPKSIACCPTSELTPAEKVFFAILRKYEKRWHGKVTAKQSTLGAEMGIQTRQVQKLVASLEQKGLLDVELRRSLRRPSFMHTHVRVPWRGMTREEARNENTRLRVLREDG